MEREKVRDEQLKAVRLTPDDGHYFYGYYDNPAFDRMGQHQLYHKVDFYERLPQASDRAELGMIDLASGRCTPFAETTCWNFQQGSMLQWHPQAPQREVIYNIRDGERYLGVVHDVISGAQRTLAQPVVNVDPTGRYALSVNFNRMFDFRPGYGYAGVRDWRTDVAAPEDDGVFLIDLAAGSSKLVLSLAQLAQLCGQPAGATAGEPAKVLINHLTFNTDGSRFLLLLRNFASAASGNRWQTALVTANADGSSPYVLSRYAKASHYHWRDPEHLVIWADAPEASSEGEQLYVLTDQSHEGHVIDKGFFLKDGHCSYSPDRRWMLYDSYPDVEHYRHLYLYDLVNGEGERLASYYSDPQIEGDIRCDLHPRWNRDGTYISFDSIHEGQRAIYGMDLREWLAARK